MDLGRCLPARRKVTQFLFPASVVFCATLLATVVEWRGYLDDKEQMTSWFQRNCLVLDKKQGVSETDSSRFRPEFSVRMSGETSEDPDTELTAWAESTPEFIYTETQVTFLLGGYDINKTYSCWLEPRQQTIVSMSMVKDLPEATRLVLVSILLSVAVISFSTMLLMVLYSFVARNDDYSDYTGSEAAVDLDAPNTAAGNKERRRLKRDQINKLLERYAIYDPESSGELRDWFCAICLEERSFGGNADASGMTNASSKKPQTKVMLPCGHDFDMTCLRTWLRRGHVCPLCTDDLRALFDPETKELLQVTVLRDDARTATPNQSSQLLGDPPAPAVCSSDLADQPTSSEAESFFQSTSLPVASDQLENSHTARPSELESAGSSPAPNANQGNLDENLDQRQRSTDAELD